ncbi:MAG: phosphoglycerate dehydrogenase [Planctomycetes bacterium]|nr:phosphoglycerate dehydrogenase [Planctomycetota bacterium]
MAMESDDSRPWRVLVADDLTPDGLEILRDKAEVRVFKGMTPEQLLAELPGTHALIVRSATTVSREVLEAAPDLLVVGRAGIGVDNVDVDAATERGIAVMNTPESGATTTAEHAIALLCSLARNIPFASESMHAGKWEKSKFTGVELTGKTFGIVGLGRIGSIVAARGQGLAMRVIAYDPHLPKDRAPEGVTLVPFERLLAESDFVSVHVPLLDATHHLFDARAFAQMKPTARLVDCARGGIVDETALCEALENGTIAGAALDVFEVEPLPADSPLRRQERLVLTPHLGASTKEASKKIGVDMAEQIVGCLEFGTVINGVNVPRIPPDQAEEVAPWLDLVTCLATLLTQAFPGPLESLRLDLQGERVGRHQESLGVAALVGAFRGSRQTVTAVNARAAATRSGVAHETQRIQVDGAFVDVVRVTCVLDGRARCATGTLLGRRGLTILELENASLDAHPSPDMILTFHDDAPGVIGRIGSILGERGINISSMQVALGGDSGAAAMALLAVDSPLDAEAVADLEKIDHVHRVARIDFRRGGR